MIGKWRSIYFCGGYCKTAKFRICRGQLPPEDPMLDPGTLITTESPAAHGWITTTDRRFSVDGKPVWLCPDCQARWKEEQDNE
jgi:hypothetical protein